ncbi:hypothetical protein Aph01nite_21010 [Acrocarpospora phusangensis]|uniref:Transcription factor zinc-finger domain-containing protein n=1 Tax=Acrocarpospora phusangensis TaxID=1070424 RepID=A0A919UJF8_9ACTN|nr:zf-TFIIB domain-containing protein [Acrocarpospora phusangensis]GIH23791.1 hypothetical protein Aph01nite_21010 [Acrocarpospora phusangensis]
MQCPKCRGNMRTFDRNGVHIEQCDGCRGIFLDYGELETLSRMENQWAQQTYAAPPPPAPGPAWGGGHHGGHGYHHGHRKSWVNALFSS